MTSGIEADKPFLDELPPPSDLGSYEYILDEESVRRHRAATHQTAGEGPAAARLAPVSILASDGLRLIVESFEVPEALHASQEMEVVNTPSVGSRITVRGRLEEKSVKKGRVFIVVATTSEDDEGRILVRARTTLALPERAGV